MLFSQGDRAKMGRRELGCYGQLGASFAPEAGRRRPRRGERTLSGASFVRRGSRHGGCKSSRLSHLEQFILRKHGVIRRSGSVLCPGAGLREGATDAIDVKRASFAAAPFAALPPQVLRAQGPTSNRHSTAPPNTGRYSVLLRALGVYIYPVGRRRALAYRETG